MHPIALALVFGAASFHVAWNYLTKSSRNKAAFLWWMNAVFSVAYLPVFLGMGHTFRLPGGYWALIAASGLGHSLYYWALGRAYDAGDLSLVYPLARGSAVLLVPLLSVPFLGERLSGLGIAGIATVLVGIAVLHLRSGDRSRSWVPTRTPGSMWALLAGLLVTGFSLVDKAGVGRIDPVAYVYLIFVAATVFFTPIALREGGDAIRETWRVEKRRIVPLGLLVPTAYLLILFAFTLSPAAYVVASREVRLVLGTLLGALLLKEGHAGFRLAGSALIVLGVMLLAFAK